MMPQAKNPPVKEADTDVAIDEDDARLPPWAHIVRAIAARALEVQGADDAVREPAGRSGVGRREDDQCV